jgi:hypothetical protein
MGATRIVLSELSRVPDTLTSLPLYCFAMSWRSSLYVLLLDFSFSTNSSFDLTIRPLKSVLLLSSLGLVHSFPRLVVHSQSVAAGSQSSGQVVVG